MEKIAVIYWSGSGNTESLAKAILAGIKTVNEKAELYFVNKFNIEEINNYSRIALGCPSMGCEVLEETEFEPFFEAIETKIIGKKVALFGSYGWGDGEWMRNWEKRVRNSGAKLVAPGLIVNGLPTEEELLLGKSLGETLAKE